MEVDRDDALKGKVDAGAAAEELNRIFTTEKVVLKQVKTIVEATLA